MSIYETISNGNTALAKPVRRAASVTAGQLRPQLRVVAPAIPAPVIPTLSPRNAAMKRCLDLLIAIPALILRLPLLALIGLAIRLDSKGPALFHQTRLGLAGKPFSILKFRTMNVLENGPVIEQAKKNDARITRIGGFLRRTSLDELPQLLNVIKGDMALVGPRPHARAHDEYFAKEIGNYLLRQAVKPGITGWAQVNGHRGETATLDAMCARVDLDIWYAARSNAGLDLKILAATPLVVLRRRNAH